MHLKTRTLVICIKLNNDTEAGTIQTFLILTSGKILKIFISILFDLKLIMHDAYDFSKVIIPLYSLHHLKILTETNILDLKK